MDKRELGEKIEVLDWYEQHRALRDDEVRWPIEEMLTELDSLRAELQAERELADRLAEAIKGTVFDYENWSQSGAIMVDMALEEHAARRSK